jgi:hypothetical protein
MGSGLAFEHVDEQGAAVPAGEADAPDRLRERVGDKLRDLGVPRPAVEVETVDAPERAPGGKLRMIVPGPPAT